MMDSEQRKTVLYVIMPMLVLLLFFACVFGLTILLFWDGTAE